MAEASEKKEAKVDVSKLMSLRILPNIGNYSNKKRGNIRLTNPKSFLKNVHVDNRPLFRVCKCVRTESTTLRGFRINFQFSCPNGKEYHAKIKPFSDASFIGISSGTESHINSDDFLGVVLFSEGYNDSSLRRGGKMGEEMMSMEIRLHIPGTPRDLKVHFFNAPSSVPQILDTVHATLDGDKWVLDMKSDNVVASIKNCVLGDEEGNVFVIVRKSSKNTLEIEGHRDIDDLMLFTIALTSFLCKD